MTKHNKIQSKNKNLSSIQGGVVRSASTLATGSVRSACSMSRARSSDGSVWLQRRLRWRSTLAALLRDALRWKQVRIPAGSTACSLN